MPKVSPILSVTCATARAECVDADPATSRGRLLPNDMSYVADLGGTVEGLPSIPDHRPLTSPTAARSTTLCDRMNGRLTQDDVKKIRL
jgi:hypothetical protein